MNTIEINKKMHVTGTGIANWLVNKEINLDSNTILIDNLTVEISNKEVQDYIDNRTFSKKIKIDFIIASRIVLLRKVYKLFKKDIDKYYNLEL